MRSYPSFERAVVEAVRQSGRIDYLFNNVGIRALESAEFGVEEVDKVFNGP